MAVATTAGTGLASADTGESTSHSSSTSATKSGNDTATGRSDDSSGGGADTKSSVEDADTDDADEDTGAPEKDSPAEEVDGADDHEATTDKSGGSELADKSSRESARTGQATKRQPRPIGDTTLTEPAPPTPSDAVPSPATANSTSQATTASANEVTEQPLPDASHTSTVSIEGASANAATPASASDTPAAPAAPAVLLGVMDWIRREVDRFFDNDLPTPDPRQVVQGTGTGVVVGTMNTTDEENDRLSFIVTDKPKYGRVTVYADGSWVYTPNKNIATDLTATGWTDSFNIRVIDRGFNLRKLQDILRGDAPGVTLPVTVTVAGYTGPSAQASGAESLADGAFAAASASASLTITRHIEVFNASSRPIRLVSYGDHLQNQVTQSPPAGAILQPGEKHDFQVVYYFLGLGQVNPTYSTLDGSATWKVHMDVQPFGDETASCQVSGSGACNRYGRPVVLMDLPGGQIEIGNGEGQKQAEALNLLCKSDTPATCSFEVKSQDKTKYAPERQVWSLQTEATKGDVKQAVKFTSSTSHSVEISAKAGVTIKKIVELELSAKYTAKFEETVENSTTFESTVPPWTHKVLLAEQPVIRYNGDFTVKMGNTTYFLRDVYFDVPDQSRAVRYREQSTPVAH